MKSTTPRKKCFGKAKDVPRPPRYPVALGDKIEGERALAAGVMRQALDDLLNSAHRMKVLHAKLNRELKKKARSSPREVSRVTHALENTANEYRKTKRWFLSDDEWTFSFRSICEDFLGCDPDRILNRIGEEIR